VSAGEHQNPEQGRLHELMAVSEAERTVDGSAEKIAAAQERERQAWAQADETAHAGISEMFVINQAGLDRFAEVYRHMGIIPRTEPEAGQ
jgi:hypothetical protein